MTMKSKRKTIETYYIDDLENNIRVASQKILYSIGPNIHEMIRIDNSLKDESGLMFAYICLIIMW